MAVTEFHGDRQIKDGTVDKDDLTSTLKTEIDGIEKRSISSMNTGIIFGGALSINAGDATKIDIAAGAGYIIDDTVVPATSTYVEWSAFTAVTLTDLATETSTDIAINSSGAVVQQRSYTNTELRSNIFLGGIDHSGGTINNTFSVQVPSFAPGLSVRDLARALGDLNLSGNTYSANGANLNIDKNVGKVFSYGRNTATSKNDPHIISTTAQTALSFNYIFQDGSGGTTVTASTTDINPLNYDDGTGTLATLGVNDFAFHNILYFPNSNNTFIQYGTTTYNKLDEAINGLATTTFPTLNGFTSAVRRGVLIVQRGTTALNNTTKARFFAADKYGSIAGSVGTGADAGGDMLTSVYDPAGGAKQVAFEDTVVAAPASSTDNAIARYDGTTGKLLQDSSVNIADNGQMSVLPGVDATGGDNFPSNRIYLNASVWGGASAIEVPAYLEHVGTSTDPLASLKLVVNGTEYMVVDDSNGTINFSRIAADFANFASDSSAQFSFTVNGDATTKTVLDFVGDNKTTPAANDKIQIVFRLETDNGFNQTMGVIQSVVTDTSNTSYAGGIIMLSTLDAVSQQTLSLIGGDVEVHNDLSVGGTVDGRDIAADGSKLDGIETGADVTDTANVTSAGALMDSEVDADIKTLSLPASTTISAFGATLVDDADASTARTTIGVTDANYLNSNTTKADVGLGNVDNTSDATKADGIWPVGTVYTNKTNAANPSTYLLGASGQTWVAITDKMIMARGSTYTTAGGAATHTHDLSDSAWAQVVVGNSATAARFVPSSPTWTAVRRNPGGSTVSLSGQANGTPLDGVTDSSSSLPPFEVAYVWERTA